MTGFISFFIAFYNYIYRGNCILSDRFQYRKLLSFNIIVRYTITGYRQGLLIWFIYPDDNRRVYRDWCGRVNVLVSSNHPSPVELNPLLTGMNGALL